VAFGRRRATPADRRRTGPADEAHWWVDDDQAFVEAPVLERRDLPRGWQTVPMPNNAERLDPYGVDPGSVAVREARDRRVLTALDEGAAWRQRKERVLLVVRVEAFADPDDRAHRAAWRTHGTDCLDAVWRERWKEREITPGWIEARWKAEDDVGAVAPIDEEGRGALGQIDWITVEDQTGTNDTGVVARYEHLSVWCGRGLVTLTVRHDDALDLDAISMGAALAAYRRLWQLDR
jgi:hypothetical protein